MKQKKLLVWLLVFSLCISLFGGITVFAAGDSSGGSASAYRGLVISRVFGSGDKKDAVTKYSFFELYNASSAAVDLDGLALYYRTAGDAAYQSFEFDPFTMAPGSYYLIRCAAAKKYVDENQIIKLTDYDAEWKISVSNKDISLVLAPAGRELDIDTPPAEIPDKVSYFYAISTGF